MKFFSCRLACTLAAIGLFGSAVLPTDASAARKKKHSVTPSLAAGISTSFLSVNPYQPESVDTLLNRIDLLVNHNLKTTTRKGENKIAHTLSLSYDALINRNYAEARALAKTVQNDELFADYANWLQAASYLEDARKSLDDDNAKQAALFAQEAFNHFTAVVNGDPYSSLYHSAPKQAALAELLWAQSLPPGKIAVKHFQNAFERLTSLRANSEIQSDEILGFAIACSRYRSTLCEAWIEKLFPLLTRDSSEYDKVLKFFPNADERPKAPPSYPHATQSYKAPDLDLAAFENALESFKSEKWNDSINKLKSFVDEFPKSTYRYRARFYLGLAFLKKHQEDDSKKVFDGLRKDSPLTVYGLFSALALGQPIDGAIERIYPQVAERDLLLTPEELFRLNRAEILLSEGANDLAGLELKGITIRPQHSSAFLMYLAILNSRAQSHPAVFQLLSELVQRSYLGVASEFGLKLIFPTEHFDAIKKYSKQFGVDPILITSLIKQESAFDTKANSGSGASGLMQLMPFTAVEVIPGITREQLIEAEMNIRAGTKYLSKLLDHYKGNIVLSLAAYNAGPGAVDRWVREGIQEKRGMMDFIEAIPFKETREYVGSIIRNYYWYSKFINHAQPVVLNYFWKPYRELNPEVGAPQLNGAPPTPTLVGDTGSGTPDNDDDLEKGVKVSPSPSASPSSSPSASPSASVNMEMGPFLPEATLSPVGGASSSPSESPSSAPSSGKPSVLGIPSVLPVEKPSAGPSGVQTAPTGAQATPTLSDSPQPFASSER